jgi:hypothetical protein
VLVLRAAEEARRIREKARPPRLKNQST